MVRPKPDENFKSIPMVVSALDDDIAKCISNDYFFNVLEPGVSAHFEATLKAVKRIRRDWVYGNVKIVREPGAFEDIINAALTSDFFLQECPPEIATMANLLRGVDLMFRRLVELQPENEDALNAQINFALTVT